MCSRSARGHRAAARGGTRPRLRAQTGRLKLGQTLPPTPVSQGVGEGRGQSQVWAEPGWARARARREGLGMSRFKKAGLVQEGRTRAAHPARAKAERGTEKRAT